MTNFNFKIILFLLFFLSLFVAINYYIGKRVASRFKALHPLNTKIFWIIFWIIAFSYIINALLRSFLPNFILNPFLYVGSYYIAIMVYLIIILPIIDIIKYVNSKFYFLPRGEALHNGLSLSLTIFIAILLGILMIYGTWNGKNSYVKNYDIKLTKSLKDNNLKIVLLSDIHLGNYIGKNRLNTMVSEVNALNPDVVLIAGDLIDDSTKPFIDNSLAADLGKLQSKYGIYLSFGNHDLFDNKLDELTRSLENNGIRVLRDTSVLIDNSFYIIGRDDISINRGNYKRKNLNIILKDVDKTKPIIVIDHNPQDLVEPYNEKVDLQVSGHTHRGQFAPFNLVTHKIFQLDYGYITEDYFNAVVSSGYGTWGPPIRIGSRSEIVEINLTGK